MEDRQSTAIRGAIAIGVATAVNLVLFYGLDLLGIELRNPVQFGATELTDMTVLPVLVLTAVPTSAAVWMALVLDRTTSKARPIFSSVVVLAAFLSLLLLISLDSSTMDRIYKGVLHLVPAVALVALVSPTLRSE